MAQNGLIKMSNLLIYTKIHYAIEYYLIFIILLLKNIIIFF